MASTAAAAENTDDRRRVLVRPSLPLVVWMAAAVWAGIATAESVVRNRVLAATDGPLVASVGAFGWIAVATITPLAARRLFGGRRATRAAVLVVVAYVAGTVLGLSWWSSWVTRVELLSRLRETNWTVEATSDPVAGRFGLSSIGSLKGEHLPPGVAGARVNLQWPKGENPPGPGRVVAVTARYVSPPRDPARLVTDMRSGKCGSLRVRGIGDELESSSLRHALAPVREWALGRAKEVPGTGGALLDGVLLGDRSRLDGTAAETAFRTTGLTHLVAVSGSHLVVVAAVVTGLAGLIGLGRGGRVALVAVVTGLYVVLSGVQVSAVRAWAMTVVVLGVGMTGRRTDPLAALGIAVVGMLVASPPAAFDLGFQLSVASVVGLVLLARLAEEWLAFLMPAGARRLAGPLGLTLVAQVATLPLTARVFGAVSLSAPVANLLVGPVVSVALVVALVGLGICAVAPGVGGAVLRGSGALFGLGSAIAQRVAALPSASVPAGPEAVAAVTVGLAAAMAAWVTWPRPQNRARARTVGLLVVAVCGVALLGVPLPRGPAVTVLDVGQGDAILLEDGGRTALVDAGPSRSAMRAAASRHKVRKVDVLLLTHDHEDHTGGFEGLAEMVRVVTIGTGPEHGRGTGAADSADGGAGATHRLPQAAALGGAVEHLCVSAGDSVRIGTWALDVLWPPKEGARSESANEESLVILAHRGDFSMLLTGDAEADVLERLARAGALEDVDAIKVPHHASRNALSPLLLEVLRPEVAVVSVGEGNRFGHPAPETLELLARGNVQTLRTDRDGDVIFSLDGRTFQLTRDRGGP